MHRPLYWLLVSDRDKPEGLRLRREPIVWLYILGSAIWGLACAAFNQRGLFAQSSDSTILEIVKWIAGIVVFALPAVILSIREADKIGARYSFEQLVVSAFMGFLTASLLGACLEFTLSFAGIHHFLGIPINKWK